MSTLEQIGKQLKALEESQRSDSTKKLEAFEGLLTEISTALSDVVAALEAKPAKVDDRTGVIDAIDSLTKAFRDWRIEAPKIEVTAPAVQVAAPHVEVHVPAAQVTNEVHVQPSQVHVVERPRAIQWKVEHKYFGGVIESSTLTPIYEGSKR